VFDPSLRTPTVHAIAVRYQTPLWRFGAMLRAGCMAGFWILLIWFPYRTLPRDAAMLALGSAGALTAWAHNRSSLLDLLVAINVVGLSRAAGHLLSARERATADLSGLLEGFGIILAALLYAGPLEVRPLPATVYALGLVLVTLDVWSAFMQAMTDASWYAPDAPPGRAVLLLRPLMPLLVAMITFAILAYPVYWSHQPVPGGLFAASLAAAVILLLLPFTAIYELVLRGARDAAAVELVHIREDNAVTVHSLVKNAARILINQVERDPSVGAETRALAREMLALSEEARLMVLGRAAELGSVRGLVDNVARNLPGGATTVTLDPASNETALGSTDYQLARRCLLDLVTNAWKAGAAHIDVAVDVEPQPGSPRTQTILRVDDDGPGMPAGVLDDPATSLAVLAENLRAYAGSLRFSPRPGGGTSVCVRWQSGW
jgi:hypothetical protein